MTLSVQEHSPRIYCSVVPQGGEEVITIDVDDPTNWDPKEHPTMQLLHWAATSGPSWRLTLFHLREGVSPFLCTLGSFLNGRRIKPESVVLESTVFGPRMRFSAVPI